MTTTPSLSIPVRLGDRGRLVLPAAVRERLGLEAGDMLLLNIESDSGIRLEKLSDAADEAMGLFAHIAPGRRLVDELLLERRQEAERES